MLSGLAEGVASAGSPAGFPGKLTVLPVPSNGGPRRGVQPVPLSRLTNRVTMVGFISALCPISNEYIDRMNALYREFSGTPGVSLLFLYPNSNESPEQIAKHMRGAGFVFPAYRDPGARVADALAARNTPEFFVLGPDSGVLYRGAFDDARTPARVKVRGVALAIQCGLRGERPETANIRALGCAIHRPLPKP